MSLAIDPGSDPRSTPHVGCPNCRQKDARIAELSRKLNEYQSQEERRKKYDHLSNQTLSAKATRFAAHLDDLDRRWKTEGKSGPQCINVEETSAELGFSKSAGRSALDELAIVGHSSITPGDPFPIKTEDGRTIEIVPVLVEVLGKDPEELTRDPRGHGGRRCTYCGSDAGVRLKFTTETRMIRRTTRITEVFCKGCGQHVSTSKTHKDELVKAPKAAQENGEQTPDTPEFQVETRSASDSSDSIQLGTEGLNHPLLIGDGADTAPTEFQVETSSPLETAVDLLCSIAGDDETHIEMMPTGDKYITRKGAVTPELAERHIRGEIMLGTTLRHADGKTRILRWEEDDAAGFERLKSAALQLLESGALPILEDSPSVDHPGGGHMMLIYNELVDAASARATAHHWAPLLKTVKETWPNGGARVRLPAGRYRHKGADAWCAVWKHGGLHVTEGAAFDLLCAHQTPAAWVTMKPPTPPKPRSIPRAGNRDWIPPTRPIPAGNRDCALRDFAFRMAGTTTMTEGEIIAELRRIVAELCEYVPNDPIKDSSLVAKTRSALQKLRGGSGLSSRPLGGGFDA